MAVACVATSTDDWLNDSSRGRTGNVASSLAGNTTPKIFLASCSLLPSLSCSDNFEIGSKNLAPIPDPMNTWGVPIRKRYTTSCFAQDIQSRQLPITGNLLAVPLTVSDDDPQVLNAGRILTHTLNPAPLAANPVFGRARRCCHSLANRVLPPMNNDNGARIRSCYFTLLTWGLRRSSSHSNSMPATGEADHILFETSRGQRLQSCSQVRQ